MSFEDNQNKVLDVHPSHNSENIDREMTGQLEAFLLTKISELLQKAVGQVDKKNFLITQIATFREAFFKERGELLDAILAKIETIDYSTDTEFEKNIAKEVTAIIVEYLASHNISWEEAKIKLRIARIEQDGDVHLDENGITYCSRYDDVVEVHITKGLTPTVWTEALSSLSKIIQDDEGIKTVRLVSWFVAEKLSDFRKLGFVADLITDENELAIIRANLDESMKDKADVTWAEAHMTREEFLNSKILKRISRK